jgi:outer membrane protein assembly factor BamB
MQLKIFCIKKVGFTPCRSIFCNGIAILLIALAGSYANGDTWPTFRCDKARSGVTSESITPPLTLQWIHQAAHAPRPAWPPPSEERPRMHFDSAYHVTTANRLVYFGSSVDHQVYALDASSGELRWTFFTDGPVRLAPAIYKNKIYFGSDDGFVYCLHAKNGKLIWKYRAGPANDKVLGNGQMISLWPVRTDVLLDDDVAYFAAGVFPSEGIYFCALKADDGSVLWKNDTVGDRAHELAFGGVSPQSYQLASANVLYVPSGRAMPAAFDKKTGEFLHYLSAGGKVGGVWALLDQDELIAGVDRSGTPAKVAYEEETGKTKGDIYAWFPGIELAITPETSYILSEDGVFAIDRTKYPQTNEKLTVLSENRKKLSSTLSDLREKRLTAKGDEGKTLEEQIEVSTREINRLAEEEKKLKVTTLRWHSPQENLFSLIVAEKTAIVGGDGFVLMLNGKTGKELWRENVNGKACGLAYAEGRLLVSTEQGPIYCFAAKPNTTARIVSPILDDSSFAKDDYSAIFESAANKIIEKSGVKKGYALVVGIADGRLAFELAKRTELKIICLEKESHKSENARKRLSAAGLYGSRVVVEPWNLSDLPDYFANLIVSEHFILTGEFPDSAEEIYRLLKPYGGVAIFGQSIPKSDQSKPFDLKTLQNRFTFPSLTSEVDRTNGAWLKLTRGELEGAGNWTQLYGNPQNTACSDDQLVKGNLGMLWFGDPGGEDMVERHARATAPVAMNGRLFIQGEEMIMAYDAYNGTLLWQRSLPGAVRVRVDVDGGNLSLTKDGLYIAANDKCYRLDPASGDVMKVYGLPDNPVDVSPAVAARRWGYIMNMGASLFGSTAMPLKADYASIWDEVVKNGKWFDLENLPSDYNPAYKYYLADFISQYPTPNEQAWAAFHRSGALWHPMAKFPQWRGTQRPEIALTEALMSSDSLFAKDTETDAVQWIYRGGKIGNITPVFGKGNLFFMDSAVTEEQKTIALNEKQEWIRKGIYEAGEEASLAMEQFDIRLLIAVDAETGKALWKKPVDVTGCGGDRMGIAYQDGVLAVFGHFSNHDRPAFEKGLLTWRRISAFDAANGDALWSRPLNYLRRPLIVGNAIIIEPRACDLRTGEIQMRNHPISGEPEPWEFYRPGHCCSITSAAPNYLFYRSYNNAFYDLAGDGGVRYYGAIRTGCWLNFIPAGGLLLIPESSSGCTCSFPLRCSIVLKQKEPRKERDWAVFIANNPITPAKHFAINLGAPGDTRDRDGNLWLAYPRPIATYGVQFDLKETMQTGGGFFRRDFRNVEIAGTNDPWLFASGCLGMTQCVIPLIDAANDRARGLYTVRFGFHAPAGDRPGQRVFDMKIQDQLVIENFDICAEAGSQNRSVVKEFNGIPVHDQLKIEWIPKTNHTQPIVNFIQAVREELIPL